jgi:hypothetical protein
VADAAEVRSQFVRVIQLTVLERLESSRQRLLHDFLGSFSIAEGTQGNETKPKAQAIERYRIQLLRGFQQERLRRPSGGQGSAKIGIYY